MKMSLREYLVDHKSSSALIVVSNEIERRIIKICHKKSNKKALTFKNITNLTDKEEEDYP
jgi:hypothetical protein